MVIEAGGSQTIFMATGVAVSVAFLFGLTNRDLRSP
jgi:hypothetical protein